jgi:hypothetical protein
MLNMGVPLERKVRHVNDATVRRTQDLLRFHIGDEYPSKDAGSE